MVNILDLKMAPELTFAVRDAPEPVENSLVSILPNREIDGDTTAVVRGTVQRFKAVFRAVDAEAPIGRRGGTLTRTEFTLPPISEKLPLLESDIKRLAQRSPDRATELVKERVYDDAFNMATSIRNRFEEARGQFLSTGTISINENGFEGVADFGLDASHKKTAATLWAAAGATPIDDEKAWIKIVRKDALVRPTTATTSEAVVDALAKSAQYRTAWNPMIPEAQAPTLSLEQVNEVRRRNGLPTLNIYDGEVPNAAGTGTQRVLAENLFILTTDTVGETQWGTTSEGIALAGSNAVDFLTKDAPGLVVAQWAVPDPVATWTKVAAVGMPVAGDINGLLVGTVLA